MEYYIGIDIGTSSAKLVLMDENGSVLNQQSEDYEISQPQSGFKEIDPEKWFLAAKTGMKKLICEIEHKKVKAIGITGQMHTTVFIDEKGDSIRPAIMWNDTRTKDSIPRLKEEIKKHSEIAHIAGIISTGSPASNLNWLKENEPENFQRLQNFLIGPDYLVFRFTGETGTDYCEASTSSLFDLNKREWSPIIRNIIGIPSKVYPKLRGSAQIVSKIKESLAIEFGFDTSVKVIAGTGDNPAAALSTGCISKNYTVLSLGTSGVLMAARNKMDFDAKGKNILFSLDNENFMTLVQGVVQSAGSSLRWWIKDVLNSEDFEKETSEIDLSNLGKSDIIFYPHLVGDKTLYADSSLRGGFLGLGTDVTRKDMVLAVMEGISFGVKELTEKMNFTKESLESIKVTGGGAKNAVWMQILADVLNTRVEQLSGEVGAAYGIALLAAYSNGKTSLLEGSDEKTICVKHSFEPRYYNSALYAEKYNKYKKIYQSMKTIFE